MSIIGTKYGRLTIIGEPFRKAESSRSHFTRLFVKAECECGNVKDYSVKNLKSGNSKSCGCQSVKPLQEIPDGARYGMLVTYGSPYRKIRTSASAKKETFISAVCDCGNNIEVCVHDIKKGVVKSCGCFHPNKTHGLSKHPIYQKWKGMTDRCYDNKNSNYHRYGGRGITICDEWRSDFKLFYEWAINNGWEDGLEIDRQNNDGNYEPSNCRFVTTVVNTRNTSIVKTTIQRARHMRILYFVGKRSQSEIAYLYGIKQTAVSRLLNNRRWNDPDFPKEFKERIKSRWWYGDKLTKTRVRHIRILYYTSGKSRAFIGFLYGIKSNLTAILRNTRWIDPDFPYYSHPKYYKNLKV